MDQAIESINSVFHLAANSGTGRSMYCIDHYYGVNPQATATTLEALASRNHKAIKVALALSRSVYDEDFYGLEKIPYIPGPRDPDMLQKVIFESVGQKHEPLRLATRPETATHWPTSLYTATKLAYEKQGRLFAYAYDTRMFALRFQNAYSEHQSLRKPPKGIISIFLNLIRKSLPINIFKEGHESWYFVHVIDMIRPIGLSFAAYLPTLSIIKVGSGVSTSVLEFDDQLLQELCILSKPEVSGDFQARDLRHCYEDLDKNSRFLIFEPDFNISEEMHLFCAWVHTQVIMLYRSEQAMAELSVIRLSKSSC